MKHRYLLNWMRISSGQNIGTGDEHWSWRNPRRSVVHIMGHEGDFSCYRIRRHVTRPFVPRHPIQMRVTRSL